MELLEIPNSDKYAIITSSHINVHKKQTSPYKEEEKLFISLLEFDYMASKLGYIKSEAQ